ncbi:hypothetical protein HHI36_009744 [Cryptolaemus montrouzieri]|uniref:Neuroendocrine protein 7B2 n=1 Tax=Cryptolaemus montrouzieri TaxID=559131 RepID=A0ABD2MGN2_9CUCU
MQISILFLCLTCAFAYVHVEKDDILPDMFLEELADRMRKQADLSYVDLGESNPIGSRSLEEEQYDPIDYDSGDAPLYPSIRDQEYLRHSSLWGTKYGADDSAGGDNQRVKPQHSTGVTKEAKTKNTLPAYCNPPNPCPVGYGGE